MNWESVDSSQISEVGYDADSQTMGIRFKAGSRSSGSEYHYSNVPPMVHRTMITAESVGEYFSAEIKKRPDLYPYTKVEMDPTPASTPARIVDAETRASTQSNGAESTIDSPSTALTAIDTMSDELLFTPGAVTDAMILAGREYYLTEAKKYDVTTEKNRTALKRFARPLQKLRTGIEARAKEITGATKRKIAAIDAEKRRLVQIVGGIEDEVLRPLTEWEQEEEARTMRLSGIVNELAAKGQRVYTDMADIEGAIAELEHFDLSTMQEHKIGAESAITASLRVLKPELERRKVAAANEAELARLRAEAAERAERDRIAQIEENAKVAAQNAAAEMAEQLKRDAEYADQKRIAAEKEAQRQIELAEARAVEAAAQAKRDAEQAIENERMRVAAEAKREREAAEARAADEAHRKDVEDEVAKAMLMNSHMTALAAGELIGAISKGLIPHVSILY